MPCQTKNVNVSVDAYRMNAMEVVWNNMMSFVVCRKSTKKNHKKSKSMKRAKDRCPVCECDPCDCGWGTCKVVEKR